MVGDPRAIWCRRALDYASRVELAQGLLFGGAHSPLFLSTDHPLDPITRRLPAALTVPRARIATLSGPADPMEAWLPFLEALREAGESLIAVSAEPLPLDVLETFVVNTERRTLIACAVHPAGASPGPQAAHAEHAEHAARTTQAARTPQAALLNVPVNVPTPDMREELPFFETALVRRDATVLLDGPADALPDRVALIHVGGADAADVAARMQVVDRALNEWRAERVRSVSIAG